MNCKNFICYRGSSSIGLSIAKNLLKAMKPFMREVTYYSNDDTDKEAKNFLTDPTKYLSSIEYFIIILTKDFFSGFMESESVTRLEFNEVIMKLKSMGFLLYILSGSVREVIQSVLGKELTKCFIEIKANRFHFDDEGLLTGIIGTPYDFDHKAAFVSRVIIEKKTKPSEILFVGNSFNDEFVYTTGVETLCINPKDTKLYAHEIWNNYIRQCDSLKDILPYCGVK